MKTTNEKILRHAIEASLILDVQLNLLLDAYDFYVERYPTETPSQQIELRGLQTSIRELGQLPRQISIQLIDWRSNLPTTLSKEGFELNVLNEFVIHTSALHRFMRQKGLALDGFNILIFGEACQAIRVANRVLGQASSRVS